MKSKSDRKIDRWQETIVPPEKRPGEWSIRSGGSWDMYEIAPIPDSMLAELMQRHHGAGAPWNCRSLPLSTADREYMYLLYYSMIGLVARMRAAERERDEAQAVIAQHDLCHNLHGKVDAVAFAEGCAAEQRKLYGSAPHADRAESAEALVASLSALLQEGVTGFSRVLVGTSDQKRVYEWVERCRAALEQGTAAAPGPFRLIPAEPSDATIERMCAAATEAKWPDDFGESARRIRRDHARAVYKAAIGA